MARIFIAIGAADHKPGSELFPVYIGRDGDAYRKAIAASKYPSLTLFQNPIGIRKTNGKAIENAALQAATEIPPTKEETSPSPSPESAAAEPASPPEGEAPVQKRSRK